MTKLAISQRVPASYDRAAIQEIVRLLEGQGNALAEGLIVARHGAMASPPAAGTGIQGDIAWNSAPASGDYLGWVCVESGSPGTWAGFGAANQARKNALINSGFRINQRAPASSADDTYAHDRWYVLTQTGAIAVSTLSDVENGLPSMARLTQSQAAAQRMGYAQIIEGKNCKHLRGKKVTFRFRRVRISASQAIRYAVLEWTGTEDAVTSDVVNDWTSTDYTDGAAKFFVDTSFTPSGNTSHTPAAATLTDGPSVTVTLGSTFNNIVLFAWTEGTAAQNVTLDLGDAQLEQGGTASELERLSYADELRLSQRYHAIYMAGNNIYFGPFQCYDSTHAFGGSCVLPVDMRASPTITASAASHFALTNAGSIATGNCSDIAFSAIGSRIFRLDNAVVASGLAAGDATHLVSTSASALITASAEL